MQNSLEKIASKLSEADIQQLLRLKKRNEVVLARLRKERASLAAKLEKLNRSIAKIAGEAPTVADASNADAEPALSKASQITPVRKSGRKPHLMTAIRMILAKVDRKGMNANQVVDAMPGIGFKVDDVAKERLRVGIMLSSKKKFFRRISKGMYRIKK